MEIGLSDYRTPFNLGQLLLLPFQESARQSSFFQPRQPLARMSSQELHTFLTQGQSLLVLDVRNPDEFVGERGHITGAVLCPLPELETKLTDLTAHRTHSIVTV